MLGGIHGTTTLSKDARVELEVKTEKRYRAYARAPHGRIGYRDVRADGARPPVSENKVTSLAALGTREALSRTGFPHLVLPLLPRVHPRSTTW